MLPAGDRTTLAVDLRVDLGPLTDAELTRIVESLVGAGVVPAPVLADAVAAAGGNPLFVEELLRSWQHRGALQQHDDGTWVFAEPAGGLAIPATVQAIYLAQLDGLPDAPREVVDAGSVPGITFPSRALPELGVPSPGAALELLHAAGLLEGPHPQPLDRHSYTYRHALLRDTAYASLPRAERARLHLRFARWLVATIQPDPPAELVGLHLAAAVATAPALPVLAADLDREALAVEAGTWLETAASRLLASAPERAARALEQVFALPGAVDVPVQLRRRLLHGEALRRAGRLDEAMAAFADAAALAADLADAPGAATAAIGYEDALFATRLPRELDGDTSIRLLTRALSLLDPGDPLRGRVLGARGRARLFAGDGAGGTDDCAAAIEAARTADDATGIARAVHARRAALTDPDDLPVRLDEGKVLVAAARESGDLEAALEGTRLQFVDLLEAADAAGAATAQQEAERLVAGLGRPLYAWYPPMWRSLQALLHGDLAAAEEAIGDLAVVGQRVHYRDVARVVAALRVALLTERGDPAGALDALQAEYRESPVRWLGTMSSVLARVGDTAGAARLLDRAAADDFAALPADLSRTYVLAMLADAAGRTARPEIAARIADLLRPWRGHMIVLGSGALCLGAADHYLALAEEAAGDATAAAVALRDAIRLNDRLGAVPAGGWSRLALAANPTVDPVERTELLDAVATVLTTDDLPALRARIDTLVRAAED